MDLVKQFEIYLVILDPTLGTEIKKTRPCVIVSPEILNSNLSTIIVAPMTSTIRDYPSRVKIDFQGKKGEVALDQIRSVDKKRLIKKIGLVKPTTAKNISNTLVEIFAS